MPIRMPKGEIGVTSTCRTGQFELGTAEKACMSDGGLLDAVLYVIRNPDEALELINCLSELLNWPSTADN